MPNPQLQHTIQLMHAGQLPEAEQACRSAIQANPGDIQAVHLLGQITRQIGKAPESVQIFQHLRQARPADPELIGELGASLTAANQHAHALPLLTQAVEQMPTAVHWKIWLGKCQLKLFNTTAAVKVLEDAHADEPDNLEVLFHLANALLTSGRPTNAEPLIRRFLKHNPDSIPAQITLANILESQNHLDEAVEVCEAILKKDPKFDAALGTLARCLRAEGKYTEALAILEPIIAQHPTANQALAVAPLYLADKRFEESKALFEQVLKEANLPDPIRASLTSGLAQAYQGLKDYDNAFRAFKRSNEYYPKTFKRDHRLRLYKEIRDSFSPDILKTGPRATIDASKCIFIVGMPRSGTSLVEQVLDAHPRVFGAGELTDLASTVTDLAEEMQGQPPSCLRELTQDLLNKGGQQYLDRVTALAPEADFIIDKLPHNFEMLGFIHRALPGATVIHCTRNPIDNCLSCFFTQLSTRHNYSTDLANLAWAYGQYVKLMDYWQTTCNLPALDVQYEDMVADLETQARRIITSVGLEWDDRCLRFYETKRAVTTASVDQVRKPIYTSSVSRWKRYEQHLTPLIESLRTAGVQLPDA